MKSYQHFTQNDICCLFFLLSKGFSKSKIAKILNKHRASVGRIIKRCPGNSFDPKVSYENYLENRNKFCSIQPEKTIHDLPEEAKYRERLNDWEGDTIRTTPGKGCIITFVDRKSRFLLAKKANNVSSDTVGKAIKEMFKSPYEVFCCT